MTVEDKNFNIKNGLSVGTGKHQVLDSNARITANYFTLNTGGRYLSAGVDLYDLISTQGVPPVSTNAWNYTHDRVLQYGDNWDSVYNWVQSDSATNNTLYNLTHYIHITGGRVVGDFGVGSDTYLEGSLRVDGHTYLSAAMYVENDAYVMGNLRADGDVWLAVEGVYPKTVYVGATNDDNIVFVADVSSNFIPDQDVTYDLGTSEQQWRELFVQDVSASRDIWIDNDLMVSGNGTIGTDFRVSGHTTIGGDTVLSGTLDVDDATYIYDTLDVELDTRLHSDLFVTNNTTISGNTVLSGTLDVREFTTLHDDLSVKGDLYVDGNAYLSAGVDGNIYVGDVNTDSVIFNADVDSNIIPDDTIKYDLGTSEQQWRELFVQDVSATRDIWIDNDLMVSGNGTIGDDFRVSGHMTVSGNTVLSGTLDVDDATYIYDTLDVELDTRLHSDLFVTDNTTVSGNTVLSGTLDVKEFTTLHDDLSVKGDLYVDGNTYLSAGVDGNIYVGDTNTDNIIFNADVDSNIIPDDTIKYDLGTSEQQWRELFVQDISASRDIWVDNDLMVSGNGTIGDDFRVSGHTTIGGDTVLSGTLDVDDATYIYDTLDVELDTRLHSDLFVTENTTISGNTVLSGTLDVKQFTTLHDDLSVKGDLYVDGNAYLSAGVDGNIYVGDVNTDNVIFNADVDSNIIPDDDITFDLGTNTQQWRELFVQDISASRDIWVDNDLMVSGNGTIGDDFRVSGHMTVSGNTVLSGTLDVDDATYIYNTLDVELKTTLHNDLLVSGNTHIIGDLRVDGNAYLSAGVDGIINVGDTNTDNVVFHADIDSGLTPNKNVTFDLGTSTQQWQELYVQDISAGRDIWIDNDLMVSGNGTIGDDFRVSGHTTVSGNTVLSGSLDVDDATYIYDVLDVELDTRLHSDLFVTNNTTISGNTVLSGTLDVKQFTTLHDDLSVKGDLYVDGNAYLSAGVDGNIYVGDVNTDSVIFNADVDSNIIPDTTIEYDLGTSEQQWRELFVQDVSATRDIWIDNDLMVSGNGTIGDDFRVSGHMTVSGNTVLSGTLDVNQLTTLHDDLSVKGDTTIEQSTTIHGHVSAVSGMSLTGNLTADDDVYIKGSIIVEGHAYFGFGSNSSQITLGDPSVDEVIFQADVGSDILPYPTNTYNIGSLSKRWLTIYTRDLDVYNQIYTRGNIITNSSIIQRKPPDQDPSDIETVQDLWKGYNGSTGYAEISIPTFDCTKYQSAQFVVMVKDETGLNITTVNADFVCNGATVNGTVYGNVNVGTMEPLEQISCVMNNNRYELKLTISKYAKAVVRGTAIYLQ
jgi:predicted acyltransferase (DUF342 family)